MKIDILTLFPEMIKGFLEDSILKRAQENNQVKINLINFRDYSKLNNHQVDDSPYGGGAGMVLRCEPIIEALESVKTKDSYIILLSPQGKTYNQKMAFDLKKKKHIILICGHYEGFDERIKNFVDLELSIGDYILTGGEIAAVAVTDSIVRLLDNVINKDSADNDSFTDNLLDYPTYTKPRDFRGLKVPEILLSGDHQKIAKWRKDQQIKNTEKLRPDLYESKKESI